MNIDTVRQVSASARRSSTATPHNAKSCSCGRGRGRGAHHFLVERPGRGNRGSRPRLNPNLRILVHTTYLRVAENLKSEGVSAVFSGEREVAVAMTEHLMRDFGATDEQIDRERRKLRERMA